jgi:hypothetical protein
MEGGVRVRHRVGVILLIARGAAHDSVPTPTYLTSSRLPSSSLTFPSRPGAACIRHARSLRCAAAAGRCPPRPPRSRAAHSAPGVRVHPADAALASPALDVADNTQRC